MSAYNDELARNTVLNIYTQPVTVTNNPRAKFPKTSRFFDNSSLPDLKTFELIRQNRRVLFNSQLTNFNYNPFSLPQQKLKASIPLDYAHLPNKVMVSATNTDNGPNDIPCYLLNESQLADPITFIDGLLELGKKYGAVKIRLPSADTELFQSTMQINSDLFWFQTNKLLNNPPEDEIYMRLKFHHDLIEFHNSEEFAKYEDMENKKINNMATSSSTSSSGSSSSSMPPTFTQVSKLPMIDKRPLDLYKLFQSVTIRGGFMEVINRKLWAQIGRELGYKGKIMTSLSSSLKSSYQKILYPYEQYLTAKKSESNPADVTIEHEHSNGKRSLLEDGSVPNKKFKPDDANVPPLVIGSAKDFRRSVKSKLDKGCLLNTPYAIDVKQPNVFTVKVDDKKRRRQNDKVDVLILPKTELDSALYYMANSEDESRLKAPPKIASVYTLRQFMEKDIKFQEFLLLANPDYFERDPGDLFYISPEGMEKLYWKYITNRDNTTLFQGGLELEMGKDIPNYINGSGFVRMGDDLINFRNCLNSEHLNLSHSKLFAIASNNPGNSKPSYFFPHLNAELKRYNESKFIKKLTRSALHPWNLHNLPILPNTVLGALNEDDLNDLGINESRLNIGMTFATENWSCEDHFTSLVNYQFFGAVKKWYFIPELEFEKFEKLVKEINDTHKERSNINNKKPADVEKIMKYLKKLADDVEYDIILKTLDNLINTEGDIRLPYANERLSKLVNSNGSFKYNQEFMISPELLDQHGIKYTTTIQQPGEYIIKFPKSYSSTMSFGFNLSEEVNLATNSWLSYSIEGEKWLAKQSIIPSFLTFKLLVNLAVMYDSGSNLLFNSDIFSRAHTMYEELYQEEINLRNEVRKLKVKEVIIDDDTNKVSDDTLVNVYPSRISVTDPKTKQSIILSLQDFLKYHNTEGEDNILKQSQLELQLYHSDEKLKTFGRILSSYSIEFESWMSNYEELMKENSDILLRTYKALLNEGEKIYSSIASSAVKNDGVDQTRFNLFKDYVENLRSFIDTANQFVDECQNLLAIKHQQRIRNGNESSREKSYSYNDLLDLVSRVPRLNFMCPEIEQILEFKTEIDNFDKASRLLLSKKNRSLQEFNDLISLGESFGLEIPSLDFIIKIRDRLKWLRIFGLIEKGVDPYGDKKEVFTIDDLRDFFQQGLKILSKSDVNTIRVVEEILNESNAFDFETAKFLKYDYAHDLDLDRLEGLAKRFSTEQLFLSMDNYLRLSKLHANLKTIRQFKELGDASYPEVKQLYNSIQESGLKFKTDELTERLVATESWIESVWTKISASKLITTLNKDVDLDHLNPKLTMHTKLVEKLLQILYKSEFSLSDDDKYEESSSYLALYEPENSDAASKYYCICREYEYGTMVECDKCKEWYHVQCVKDVSNPDDDKYTCPTCLLIGARLVKDGIVGKQITLHELKEIYAEGKALKTYPVNELTILNDLIMALGDYHKTYQHMIYVATEESNIEKKLDVLRFILRKLYASGVLLEDLWEHVLDLIKEFEEILKEAQRLEFVMHHQADESLKVEEEQVVLKVEKEEQKMEATSENTEAEPVVSPLKSEQKEPVATLEIPEGPVVEDPVTGEPVAEETAAAEPASKEPPVESVATEPVAAEKSTDEEPKAKSSIVVEEPAAEAASEEPVAEARVVEAVAEKPTAEADDASPVEPAREGNKEPEPEPILKQENAPSAIIETNGHSKETEDAQSVATPPPENGHHKTPVEEPEQPQTTDEKVELKAEEPAEPPKESPAVEQPAEDDNTTSKEV
ncbi:Protein ECM5 [Candida viswanathii]|uniref:Protein ECM5 n=1 Tax=Candida viswanathii TaxID=5486 RepID=A0A367Y3X7_9ASCO|nr:Protein ECM5 [Candida viswanathii]